ncbi:MULTISPECIES: RNA polymerase sigma factor [Sphingobacterium]|uniref:RNA polymerase sigma factor n=1 Tax=Sphingobacterium populi TaxID=1812824 RepID=A0ABW5UEI7_9SPHI|nr:RNA polymerase sigma-70 factor [Sphingobacterium sp. CFCC 11742]
MGENQVYSEYEDLALISLLATGDKNAFAEIFERYNTVLFGHVYNKLRNREEARDVVQEVFVKLWEKRESLNITTNFSGYLFTMARNSVFKLLEHKTVINNFADSYNQFRVLGESVTDHLARERQLAALIDKEIASLPPKMREIFELSRKQHLSHREIATMLNISELTVKDQVKKALRQLRKKIGACFILVIF